MHFRSTLEKAEEGKKTNYNFLPEIHDERRPKGSDTEEEAGKNIGAESCLTSRSRQITHQSMSNHPSKHAMLEVEVTP